MGQNLTGKEIAGFLLFGCLVIGGFLIWVGKSTQNQRVEQYQENRRQKNAQKMEIQQEAEFSVDLKEMVREYTDNEIAADAKYKGKRQRVTGVLRSIDKDMLGNPVVLLEPNVALHFDLAQEPSLLQLRRGNPSTFVCTGNGLIWGGPEFKNCRLSQ